MNVAPVGEFGTTIRLQLLSTHPVKPKVQTNKKMEVETDPLAVKKRKSRENKNIYDSFLETYTTQDMTSLKKAIKSLLSDKQSSLKVCSITEANCSSSFSFKHAYLNVEEHIDTLYPFGAIFTTGLGSLIHFLKTNGAPVETRKRSALESLLAYLLDKGRWFL